MGMILGFILLVASIFVPEMTMFALGVVVGGFCGNDLP